MVSAMQIFNVDKDNLFLQFSGGRFGAVGMQSEATGRGLGLRSPSINRKGLRAAIHVANPLGDLTIDETHGKPGFS